MGFGRDNSVKNIKFTRNYELMRARLDPSHNRKQKVRINISHAEESTHKTQNGSNRVRCGRRDSDASKMMRQVSCTDEIQKTSSLGLFVDEMVRWRFCRGHAWELREGKVKTENETSIHRQTATFHDNNVVLHFFFNKHVKPLAIFQIPSYQWFLPKPTGSQESKSVQMHL